MNKQMRIASERLSAINQMKGLRRNPTTPRDLNKVWGAVLSTTIRGATPADELTDHANYDYWHKVWGAKSG